uniref:Uncharacterized protein n=1 Tax=Ackermannviridae sp. ctkHJ36 TaxID=2825754 RepID=A0A8S5UKF2_9CAUD|nr:MAG TPA: hypothetical protein [Ackermannviridae sp. ctkHJ36]
MGVAPPEGEGRVSEDGAGRSEKGFSHRYSVPLFYGGSPP